MRNLMLAAGALALMGSSAIADEVVIHSPPGVVVEHRAADEGTTTTKTVHRADGCTTHSVQHSDDATGSSVTRTRSDC